MSPRHPSPTSPCWCPSWGRPGAGMTRRGVNGAGEWGREGERRGTRRERKEVEGEGERGERRPVQKRGDVERGGEWKKKEEKLLRGIS